MKFLAQSMLAAAALAGTVAASLEADSAPMAAAGAIRRHHNAAERRSSSAGKTCSKVKVNAKSGGSKKTKTTKKKSSSSSASAPASDATGKVKQNDAVPTGNFPKGLSGKQGLAWPNSNGMKIQNFLIGKVNWFYTWAATPMKTEAPEDTLFCSMLWGDGGSGGNLQDYISNVVNKPESNDNRHKCTMAMNEVNQKGQADMSVSRACDLMRKYQVPLKKNHGYYLMGPSTTSAPDGLDKWYKQFMSQCKDVFDEIDAVPLHWYDVNLNDFKVYVKEWHEKTGKDIWVTEMACQNFNGGAQCSKQQAHDLLIGAAQWMDQQDYVKGYTTFGVMQNLQGVSEVNRMSVGSNPTSLFRAWANV